MSKISIIIPVFNGLKFTRECIKNLKDNLQEIDNEAFIFSIVLIDDGSTDGTFEWVTANHPDVHILKGKGNLWWSGGINMGVKYALDTLKTDYLLWWNNDIIPHNDYFVNLIRILNGDSNSNVLVGSKIFILNKSLIWGMGGKFDATNGDRYMHGEHSPDSDAFLKPLEVDWFPGMGTIIHKSVFENIGFLDEVRFPQYHGDSDYTYRAKKAGFKLIAYPDLIIFNDITNTGIKHNNSIKHLYLSLTSIKSNYNFKKDLMFFKKHSISKFAYFSLVKKYSKYVGGFVKWYFLGFFGFSRK